MKEQLRAFKLSLLLADSEEKKTPKYWLDAFYELIEKYCQALETIAQKYEQAEAQNAEIASNRSYK